MGLAIARPDRAGRLRLPTEARVALDVPAGSRTELRGICGRVALTVHPDGAGAPLTVDCRGRISVPAWLCRRRDQSLLVGTNNARQLLVVAPATVLDELGDTLAGVSG